MKNTWTGQVLFDPSGEMIMRTDADGLTSTNQLEK